MHAFISKINLTIDPTYTQNIKWVLLSLFVIYFFLYFWIVYVAFFELFITKKSYNMNIFMHKLIKINKNNKYN